MWWIYIVFYLFSSVTLLFIAKLFNQGLFKIHLNEYLNQRDNTAVGIEVGGMLFGVILIISSSMVIPIINNPIVLLTDFVLVLVKGLSYLVLTSFMVKLFGRILLWKNVQSSINEGNIAPSIVIGSLFIALSLLTTNSITIHTTDLTSTVVFFILGLVFFIAVTFLFRFLTSYDDVKEIQNGNLAAALSYGGLIIGIGIVVSYAINGDFNGYEESLWAFFDSAIIVLLFYPVRQFLVQGLILGCGYKLYGGKLDDEISRDKNIGAGAIEAIVYIATAIFSVKFLDIYIF